MPLSFIRGKSLQLGVARPSQMVARHVCCDEPPKLYYWLHSYRWDLPCQAGYWWEPRQRSNPLLFQHCWWFSTNYPSSQNLNCLESQSGGHDPNTNQGTTGRGGGRDRNKTKDNWFSMAHVQGESTWTWGWHKVSSARANPLRLTC